MLINIIKIILHLDRKVITFQRLQMQILLKKVSKNLKCLKPFFSLRCVIYESSEKGGKRK